MFCLCRHEFYKRQKHIWIIHLKCRSLWWYPRCVCVFFVISIPLALNDDEKRNEKALPMKHISFISYVLRVLAPQSQSIRSMRTSKNGTDEEVTSKNKAKKHAAASKHRFCSVRIFLPVCLFVDTFDLIKSGSGERVGKEGKRLDESQFAIFQIICVCKVILKCYDIDTTIQNAAQNSERR